MIARLRINGITLSVENRSERKPRITGSERARRNVRHENRVNKCPELNESLWKNVGKESREFGHRSHSSLRDRDRQEFKLI